MPDCGSYTSCKGLLHGSGRAVFDGRIVVRPHADKSDAHLNNANLLLSRKAEVDTKPQLEIHADDVKCSHGATVGELDPAQLFYLRSRGMPEVIATDLLVLAFLAEELNASKPAPDMFHAAIERAGVTPERIVHVGDHPEHDVQGAREVGMRNLTAIDQQLGEIPIEPGGPAASSAASHSTGSKSPDAVRRSGVRIRSGDRTRST